MSDHFRKKRIKRYGGRGTEMKEGRYEDQDLDSMEQRVVEIDEGFCNCGAPFTGDKSEVYRCAGGCEALICSECRVTVSSRNYCAGCAARDYRVDKDVYQMLILADHGVLPVESMVEVEVLAGGGTEIRVDEAVNLLVDRGFVSIDDGSITPAGRESLYVGDQIWGDDEDVDELKRRIRINEVANEL